MINLVANHMIWNMLLIIPINLPGAPILQKLLSITIPINRFTDLASLDIMDWAILDFMAMALITLGLVLVGSIDSVTVGIMALINLVTDTRLDILVG